MPRYTQEDKDRALGALMASAVLQDGQWVPNFNGVSGTLGMPRSTLQRWWKSRDRAGDERLRAGVARARDEVMQEGASDLFKLAQEAVKLQLTYIADECHYDTDTYTDESGREHRKGARLDHATRAMQVTLASIEHIQALLSDEKAVVMTPAQRAAAAMRRTKLGQTLRDDQERNQRLGGEAAK